MVFQTVIISFTFTCSCPVFIVPLIKETVFPTLYSLACLLCCRLIDDRWADLFMDFLSNHTRATALSNSMKLSQAGGQPKMGGSWWRDLTECGSLEKEWQTTSVFLP